MPPEPADTFDLNEFFVAVPAVSSPNQELQAYAMQQVEIDGAHISLEADWIQEQYISGKAESIIAFRYGTFAFRVNTVRGKGLFPAIWLLPTEGGAYPELDIYELLGNEPHILYGVLHYMDGSEKARDFFQYDFPEDDIPETCQIRFEWTPEEIAWYLEDEKLHSIQENIPDQYMYMIINLAVGGEWPGDPDENTQFPTSFEVDVLEFEPRELYLRQAGVLCIMEVKRVEQKFILNRQESLLLKKRLEPTKEHGTISAGCRQRGQ